MLVIYYRNYPYVNFFFHARMKHFYFQENWRVLSSIDKRESNNSFLSLFMDWRTNPLANSPYAVR